MTCHLGLDVLSTDPSLSDIWSLDPHAPWMIHGLGGCEIFGDAYRAHHQYGCYVLTRVGNGRDDPGEAFYAYAPLNLSIVICVSLSSPLELTWWQTRVAWIKGR